MYYWTHTETPVNKQAADIGKLAPSWPPNNTEQDEIQQQHGLKYTEAGTMLDTYYSFFLYFIISQELTKVPWVEHN